MPFPKACWKNIDFYTILKPKSRLFRRRRTSKNSDFACEGCHFFENSLIEVGSRKKRARRRSGEAILGSKMGSKWEKWGPKGRSKSELFLRFKKVTQEHAANLSEFWPPGWSVPRNYISNDQFSVKINSTWCIVYRESQAVPGWEVRGQSQAGCTEVWEQTWWTLHHSPAQSAVADTSLSLSLSLSIYI